VKRGDVVIVADPSAGDFAGKPRPAVIIQNTAFAAGHPSVTICIISSQLTGLSLFRLPVPANEATGLLKASEVCIDKVQTVWTHRVGKHVGRLSDQHMFSVDQALRSWLAL
jgi:mRNA interferase MazF